MNEPTIILGADGVEYVVRDGKLVEKCLHKVTRDESAGQIRKIVCHDCGKIMIYHDKSKDRDDSWDPVKAFRDRHGRNPRGEEMAAMF